jgi:hypothetical protein
MIYSRYNISLLCTSAIYFYVWVVSVLAGLVHISEPELYGIYTAFALLYPLSVFGSISFVALNQGKSDKWFLGLPLLIVILALVLIPYDTSGSLLVLLPILIAPASALFIQSVPKEHRKSAKKYVIAAIVVNIHMAITGIIYFINTFLLIDQPLNFIVFLMGLIYVVFGLPFIGICLVFMAKEKQPDASIPKHVKKPVLNGSIDKRIPR